MKYFLLLLLTFAVACSDDDKEGLSDIDQKPEEKKETEQIPQPEPPMQEETISIEYFDIEFDMVYVEGGTFEMGKTDSLYQKPDADESPVHQVTLSSYYIGKYPVTQEIWKKVMGEEPSQFIDPQKPMFNMNWYECMQFIDSLNAKTGKNFKLPTEAQWEFAARGGNKTHGYLYAGSDTLDLVSWYKENARNVGTTSADYGVHKVGTKLPNELGIYDMAGNVWNWCRDYYADYTDEPQIDPEGPEVGEKRVSRGGSWFDGNHGCRVSDRWGYDPEDRELGMGLRIVYELK